MIDLRSDTVTRPTPEMREAMASAPVGDDVYGEDPTVNELEARVAELLGKDAAVFVPSGTMSNQVALRVHTRPGDLALMERRAHMVINEVGGAALLAGVTIRALDGESGVFGADAIHAEMEPPHPFNPTHLQPRPRLVCVENTHNAGGGVVWSLERLREVADAAREHGLGVHMDGARLWHASAASSVDVADLAAPFDTVSVCFSKGLGAPVGSALVGERGLIDRARRIKQQYGGGLRQAGVLAAGALYALRHHRDRLGEDIAHARLLAEALCRMDGVSVDLNQVQSNIVRFAVASMTPGEFVDRCHERGVHMLPGGARGARAVMHLEVEREDVLRSIEVIAEVLEQPGG